MYKSSRNHFIYAPVPKIASTSAKWLIYNIENDLEYDPFRDGPKRRAVHQLPGFKATAFVTFTNEELNLFPFRFCIVRDPVDRLISCYNEKLRPQKIKQYTSKGHDIAGQIENFDAFVENLEQLTKQIKTLYWHTLPQSYFLGNDASVFTNVYAIHQFKELQKKLSQYVGKDLPDYHKNKSKNRGLERSKVSPATKAAIENLYEEDLNVWELFLSEWIQDR